MAETYEEILERRRRAREGSGASSIEPARGGGDSFEDVLARRATRRQAPEPPKRGFLSGIVDGASELSDAALEATLGSVEDLRAPGLSAAAGFARGVLQPSSVAEVPRWTPRSDAGKGIVGALKAVPGVGSAVEAVTSREADPFADTGFGMARDIGRTLGEVVMTAGAAGVAGKAPQAGKVMKVLGGGPARAAATGAGLQELKRTGAEQPVQSAANIAASAGGAQIGRIMEPFVARGASIPARAGRALATEAVAEVGAGTPANVLALYPQLEKLSSGEALTPEEREAVKAQVIASGVGVFAGALLGMNAGAAQRARSELEAMDAERMAADAKSVESAPADTVADVAAPDADRLKEIGRAGVVGEGFVRIPSEDVEEGLAGALPQAELLNLRAKEAEEQIPGRIEASRESVESGLVQREPSEMLPPPEPQEDQEGPVAAQPATISPAPAPEAAKPVEEPVAAVSRKPVRPASGEAKTLPAWATPERVAELSAEADKLGVSDKIIELTERGQSIAQITKELGLPAPKPGMVGRDSTAMIVAVRAKAAEAAEGEQTTLFSRGNSQRPAQTAPEVLKTKLENLEGVGRLILGPKKSQDVEFFLGEVRDAHGRRVSGKTEHLPDGPLGQARLGITVDPDSVDFWETAFHEVKHAARRAVVSPKDNAKVDSMFSGTVKVSTAPDGSPRVTVDGSPTLKRLTDAVLADDRLPRDAKLAVLRDIAAVPEERWTYGSEYHRGGKLKSGKWLVDTLYEPVREFVERITEWSKKNGFRSGKDIMRTVSSGAYERAGGKARFGDVVYGGAQQAVRGLQREAAVPEGGPLRQAATRAGAKAAGLVLPRSVSVGETPIEELDKFASRSSVAAGQRDPLAKRFKSAFKGATEEQLLEGDALLRGRVAPDDASHLTDDQKAVLGAGRAFIDGLSRELRESGATPQQLRDIIEKNEGSYLRRFYAVDTDKGWGLPGLVGRAGWGQRVIGAYDSLKGDVDSIRKRAAAAPAGKPNGLTPEEDMALRFADAKDFIRDDKGMSDEDADYLTRIMLDKRGSDQGFKDYEKTRAPRMAPGPLQARKAVPEPLRRLWGEVIDPETNFNKTASDIAQEINAFKFMRAMRDARRPDGSRYFYDEGDVEGQRLGGATLQVPGEPGTVTGYSVLSGMYTTPEMMAALKDITPGEEHALLRYANGLNVPFQKSATIFNPATQLRNIWGNTVVFSYLANASPFNPANRKEWADGIREAWHRDGEFSEYAEHNLFGRTLPFNMPDVKDAWRNIETAMRKGDSPVKAMGKAVLGAAKWTDEQASFFYQFADHAARLAAAKVRAKHNGGDTAEAARWVNQFFPDYSRVPQGIRALQRVPFASPFLSFRWDMPRVFANAALYNPLKFGLLTGAVGGLMAGMPELSFTDKAGGDVEGESEKRAKLDSLLNVFHRDGSNVFFKTPGADGKLLYVNLENVLPSEGLLNMPNRMRPTDFILGGPASEALGIAWTGVDARDRQVGDKPFDLARLQGAAETILGSYVPARFDADRIIRALGEKEDAYGRVPSKTEAFTAMSGVRPVEVFWDVATFQRLGEEGAVLKTLAERAKRDLNNNPSADRAASWSGDLREALDGAVAKRKEILDAFKTARELGGSMTKNRRDLLTRGMRAYDAKITELRNLMKLAEMEKRKASRPRAQTSQAQTQP